MDRFDGVAVIPEKAKTFWTAMRDAPASDRVVLPDGRPALRSVSQVGTFYRTLHPLIWQASRKILKEYGARALVQPVSRTRLCQSCLTPMAVKRELEGIWVLACPMCESVELWGKQLVGGTQGAGDREKLPSGNH